MSREIPHDQGLALLLAVITGTATLQTTPPSGLVEVSYSVEAPLDGRVATHIPAGQPHAFFHTVSELASRGTVAVGLALRDPSDPDAVLCAHALWVEFAGVAAARRVARHRHPPTLTLREGESLSRIGLWALSCPVTPAGARYGNRRLAELVECAKAPGEPTHAIPPPGALIRRPKKTALTMTVTAVRPSAIYEPEDLVPGLTASEVLAA